MPLTPSPAGLRTRPLSSAIALAASLALAACGGGSSRPPISTPPAQPAPTPVPAPTPGPTPTPTPPPTNFDTAELRRSTGPSQHNAVTAWQRGIAGSGSSIAIIDTGIDRDSPEFAGRISAASADVAGNADFQAVDDHGTNVALVAAAARDNSGIVGIAYNASIIALRADQPGSCTATEGDSDLEGCVFTDRDIATGVDRAVAAGATVINLSLGGSRPTQRLNSAIAAAVAAGIVIVVAAGNDGDSTDAGDDPNNPDPFAQGVLAAGGSNVIIVGSVGADDAFSAFSNRAGNQASFFLSARGERICCVYENGSIKITTDANGDRFVTLFSGTSFAAPQVAGAVALLKQAFPNLTGRQMVEILLASARDAGAMGTDAIYGRGILDIARALAPSGATSLAGIGAGLALADDTGTGSAPMGDALANVALETILMDKYQRAYGYDAGARLRGAAMLPRLQGAVERGGRTVAGGNAQVSLAFTIDASGETTGARLARPLQLSGEDAERARVLAGRVAMKLSPDTQLGVAFSQGPDGLAAHLQEQERPAFLIANEASGEGGFLRTSDTGFALRHRFGETGVTLSAASGKAWLGTRRRAVDLAREDRERFGLSQFAVAADRQFGSLDAVLGVDWLREERTILGAYLHDAFGGGGADSLFVDASLGYSLADGWRIGASSRQGMTRARRVGTVGAGSDFRSSAYSFDVTKSDTLHRGDSLGLRLSQPLRVESGGLDLHLPVAYDYATESAEFGIRHLYLAPSGREWMGEIAWRGYALGGNLAASVFYRTEPGHHGDAHDDAGLAMRWNRRF